MGLRGPDGNPKPPSPVPPPAPPPRSRDFSTILMDALDLYRATLEALPVAPSGLSPAARERALQSEMKAMGHLHVALCTQEGHYKAGRAGGGGYMRMRACLRV